MSVKLNRFYSGMLFNIDNRISTNINLVENAVDVKSFNYDQQQYRLC